MVEMSVQEYSKQCRQGKNQFCLMIHGIKHESPNTETSCFNIEISPVQIVIWKFWLRTLESKSQSLKIKYIFKAGILKGALKSEIRNYYLPKFTNHLFHPQLYPMGFSPSFQNKLFLLAFQTHSCYFLFIIFYKPIRDKLLIICPKSKVEYRPRDNIVSNFPPPKKKEKGFFFCISKYIKEKKNSSVIHAFFEFSNLKILLMIFIHRHFFRYSDLCVY